MIQVAGLVLNIILFASAWWAARFIFRQRGAGTQILAAGILAWSWCILGMQILGSFSLLSLGGVGLWVGLGLAVSTIGRFVSPSDTETLPVSEPEPDPPLSWCALLCLTVLIWVCLELALRLFSYPVQVNSDGPIYHLYFAIRWWKAGKYFLVAAPFGENAATYFPANGDLWFTWLMIAWDGDQLARVGQVPFLMLAGLSAYRIARMLGAGCSSSVIATTWFLTSTAFLVFSFAANVDAIFIANYLMAAYFFLRFARGEDGAASLFLGGLAAGGALGTKSVAIVFVPPLLVLTLLAVLFRPGDRKFRVARLLILIVTPLVPTGFWYFQSTVLMGNPLYPLRVEVFGHPILTGWYGPEAMKLSPFYIPVSNWRAFGDILVSVLDPRLVPLWGLSVLGIWAIPRSQRQKETRWIWLVAMMAVANILLYWLLIPYRTQQRFMLHALGLAVAALAQTLDRAKWLRALATFLVILHVVTPQTWPIVLRGNQPIPWDLTPMIPNFLGPPLSLFGLLGRVHTGPGLLNSAFTLAISTGLGLLSFIVVWSWSRRAYWQRPGGLAIPIVSTAVLGLAGYLAYSPGDMSPRLLFYPSFPDFYRGWMNFDSASGPHGSRVAYAGTNIPYYLFGAGLRNEVLYVNVDEHRDWLLHDYHRQAAANGHGVWPNSRPGWDRAKPDYESWLANLDAERIKLLVVTRVNTSEGSHNVADVEGFPIERQWADTHPDRFQCLYGAIEHDPWFRLYRLVRP